MVDLGPSTLVFCRPARGGGGGTLPSSPPPKGRRKVEGEEDWKGMPNLEGGGGLQQYGPRLAATHTWARGGGRGGIPIG